MQSVLLWLLLCLVYVLKLAISRLIVTGNTYASIFCATDSCNASLHCVCLCPSIYLSLCLLPACLPIYPAACLSVYLPVSPPLCPSRSLLYGPVVYTIVSLLQLQLLQLLLLLLPLLQLLFDFTNEH